MKFFISSAERLYFCNDADDRSPLKTFLANSKLCFSNTSKS